MHTMLTWYHQTESSHFTRLSLHSIRVKTLLLGPSGHSLHAIIVSSSVRVNFPVHLLLHLPLPLPLPHLHDAKSYAFCQTFEMTLQRGVKNYAFPPCAATSTSKIQHWSTHGQNAGRDTYLGLSHVATLLCTTKS